MIHIFNKYDEQTITRPLIHPCTTMSPAGGPATSCCAPKGLSDSKGFLSMPAMYHKELVASRSDRIEMFRPS